jgi:thiamine-phosphate pyrophosphorylase
LAEKVKKKYPMSDSRMDKTELLAQVQLYVIADKKLCRERDIEEVVIQAIEGGAQMIQYRDKESNFDGFLESARRLGEICRKMEVPFVVNDEVVIASEIGADGVHLGNEDMPVKEAKDIIGPHKIVGKSARTVRQAKTAEDEGADYIGLGPVFYTDSKQIDEPIGVDVIRRAAKSLRIPLFAIGGINLENLDQLIDAGGRRIAVISAVVSSENVKASAASLLDRLRNQNLT